LTLIMANQATDTSQSEQSVVFAVVVGVELVWCSDDHRRRDAPLREKTLWRMLYESASRAVAVLALNIEDLDLPNKQAKITAKGGDVMWITRGTPRRVTDNADPRPTGYTG
jgi:site-specific recombinase XerD